MIQYYCRDCGRQYREYNKLPSDHKDLFQSERNIS